MQAMANVLAVIVGSSFDAVLLMHTAMPIAIKIALTNVAKDIFRHTENRCLRKTIVAIAPTNAIAHHTYNIMSEGAVYCHAIPTISGMSSRRNGIWSSVYRGALCIV